MAGLGETIPLTLTLRYKHPLGALAPYFRGLESGKAVAARCAACGKAWFPPQLACPDDGSQMEWTELAGIGRIVSISIAETVLPFGGAREKHTFALVAFDGATNLSFGRIASAATQAAPGMRVRLARSPGVWPHPAQAAWFVLQP